jgi:hypothetical protein
MAFAFVQGTTGDSDTTPVVTTAFASAVTAGNIIVVAPGGDGGYTGAITGVSDNYGNTYARVSGFDIANGAGTLNLDCWIAKVVTGAASGFAISVAFNDTNGNCCVVAQEFSGFSGTPTVDKFARQENASSTTTTSGATANTTVNDELVVGIGIHASTASAYSLGTGYTNLTQKSVAARQTAMESKVISSTGAQTATMTSAAARVNIGGVVTIYDAVSGTAVNDARAAKTAGKVSTNSTRSAKTTGKATANAERSAKLGGRVLSNDARLAKLSGTATTNAARSAKTTGKVLTNDARSSKLTGVATAVSSRSAKITGKSTANSERSAKLTGVLGSQSERNAKLSGIATTANYRSAKITGRATANDARAAKLAGKIAITSERASRISGRDFAQSERVSNIRGKISALSERGGILAGINNVHSERSAKITGIAIPSSERFAKLTGRLPLIASVKRVLITNKTVEPTIVPSGLQNSKTVIESNQRDNINFL